MIFPDLKIIENTPIDQRLEELGSKRKLPYTSKNFRSNMMLNPLNLKHLNRIDTSQADMITLNLEDAIAPSRKKEALYNIGLFLSHLDSSQSFIIVRTNPIDEGGDKEIEFLNNFSFDAVRLPKVSNQKEIAHGLKLLSPKKELHISLETKEAFENLSTLRIDPRVTTANLGILDLLSSLGLPQSLVTLDNPTIEYILSKFLVDAKTAGILPISFMYQEYENLELFREWCQKEKRMGFTTKACMGPAQVAIAHKVFGLSQEALQRAEYIKNIFQEQSAQGVNGFMDEKYGFIDEPIYRDALLVLEQV